MNDCTNTTPPFAAEIAAMTAIANGLAGLSGDSIHRVLTWAWNAHITDPALEQLRAKGAPIYDIRHGSGT